MSKIKVLLAVLALGVSLLTIGSLQGQPVLLRGGTASTMVPGQTVVGATEQASTVGSGASSGASSAASHQSATAFESAPLRAYANSRLDFQSPPVGAVTLGGVPFELSEQAFKTQSSFPPGDAAPTQVTIGVQVPQAYRLHLLLNTGNGFTLYQDKVVGEVNVVCSGVRSNVASLQLGREVREWHSEGKVVDQASRPREVWRGVRTDAPALEGHIDLLSLDLPPVCREEGLSAVEIVDVSASSLNSLDPALNLVGLTVEHYP